MTRSLGVIDPKQVNTASWVVIGGREAAPGSPLNVPIVPASNFIHGGEREYSRDDGTPTWAALEDVVGGLEHGKALAFASGMAATAAVFDQLPPGARVVIPADCYQGVARLATRGATQRRWTVERIATDDTAGWIDASATADLIWIESPSNPLLVVGDLPAIASASRRDGAILAVDNTFATPLNQRPLLLGADVCIHAATKYLGGHSDLLAGLVVTTREDLLEGMATTRALQGATPGALEAYLAVRGIRTLAVRLAASERAAMTLAQRLVEHSNVDVVRYPGLETHPTHAIAARVLGGFGSMISFDVVGGAPAADAVCRRLNIVRHTTSLGSVESTIERRAGIPGQEHLPPGLLRLSVGCEHVEDLWRDLDGALGG